MKKTLYFVLTACVVIAAGCKSKQSITEIPQGAFTEATSTPVEPVKTVEPTPPIVETPVVEETRAESFEVVAGEVAVEAKFFVVVGSFKNATNAENLRNTLLSEGYTALTVLNESQMLRVIIATYNDYKSAQAGRNRAKGRFSDAWILVQK